MDLGETGRNMIQNTERLSTKFSLASQTPVYQISGHWQVLELLPPHRRSEEFSLENIIS